LRSQQGDTDAARVFFQRALPFYQQGGYRKEVFALYAILGRAQDSGGDYGGARQTFQEQLQLAEQSGDPQSIALAHEGLGKEVAEGVAARLDGFADTSTLSAESLPSGVTATFSKATFSVWQFGETTLTLRAAADADLGDADIEIVATSGSIRGSQKLHVHVID